MSRTLKVSVAIVVVVHIADFVGFAVAVLVGTITGIVGVSVGYVYPLEVVGAASYGQVEVAIGIIKTRDSG